MPVDLGEFDTTYSVRVTTEARDAMAQVIHRIQGLHGLRWREKAQPTKEAAANALFFWLRDLLEATHNPALGPSFQHYLNRVDVLLKTGNDSGPGGFDGGLPPGVKLVASGGEGEALISCSARAYHYARRCFDVKPRAFVCPSR